MYVERQVGNQCRRHALNAFFQGGVVQWGDIEIHAATNGVSSMVVWLIKG